MTEQFDTPVLVQEEPTWDAPPCPLPAGKSDAVTVWEIDPQSEPLSMVLARYILHCVLNGLESRSLIEACPGAGKSTLARTLQSCLIDRHQKSAASGGLKLLTITQSHSQAQDFLEKLASELHERHRLHADVEILAISGKKSNYDRARLPEDCADYVHLLKDSKSIIKAINSCTKPYQIVISNMSKLSYQTSSQGPSDVADFEGQDRLSEIRVLKNYQFDTVICDEAYQVGWGFYLEFMRLSKTHILIGDSGQIGPFFNEVLDECAWTVHGPTLEASLPKAFMEQASDGAGLQLIQLNRSYRLPQSTVKIIQPAFYPQLAFAGVHMGQERQTICPSFASPQDSQWIDQIMFEITQRIRRGDSLIAVELPDINDVDLMIDLALSLMMQVRQRLLDLQIQVSKPAAFNSKPGAFQMKVLEPSDTMLLVSTQSQVAALRSKLFGTSTCFDLSNLLSAHPSDSKDWQQLFAVLDNVYSEIQKQGLIPLGSANQLQGLESAFAFGIDPLLGQTELTSFSLESGRTCVMTTRHTHCAIFFTSKSVQRLLQLPLRCPDRRLVNDPAESIHKSYYAQRRFYDRLRETDSVVCMPSWS